MKKSINAIIEFSRKLNAIEEESFSSAIFEAGATGIKEELITNKEGIFEITAFFPPGAKQDKTFKIFIDNIKNIYPIKKISVGAVKNVNWEENWKKNFKKLGIGKDIIVLPPWEYAKIKSRSIFNESYQRTDKEKRNVYIVIDPGMAFGTGTHETTQLNLEYIEETGMRNKEVLDIGSGSGILSIAAGKFGAGKITAVESDINAISNMRSNFFRNKINRKVSVYKKDALQFLNETGKGNMYDIIICNMLMSEFMPLLPVLKDHLKKDSEAGLILSGYLISEKEEVENFLSKNKYIKISEKTKGLWAAGFFKII